MATLVLAALAAGAVSCAHGPGGPAFEWAPTPPPNRGRLYIYRIDPRESLATVAVHIDGLDLGKLANGEYETTELSAGPHRLRAGMRGLAFTTWGWNTHEFEVGPGDIVFLRLSVRLEANGPSTPATSSPIDIPGRPESSAQQNVFVSHPTRDEAARELRSTHRLVDTRRR